MSRSAYLYGQEETLAWASGVLNQRFRSDATSIGHARGGRIVGAVVYDTFSPGSCCISLASDGSRRWMTREFAVRAMAYPFLQLRCRRLTCFVSQHNADSLRFTRKFGWAEEGRLRRAGVQGEDLMVFGMLAEESRFLPENNPGIFPAKRSVQPGPALPAQDKACLRGTDAKTIAEFPFR